jgi:hypothetical protein
VHPQRGQATLALVALVKIGAPISDKKSDNGTWVGVDVVLSPRFWAQLWHRWKVSVSSFTICVKWTVALLTLQSAHII